MIYSREEASTQIALWKNAGEKVVFTNGCFDIMHPGHVSYLADAKSYGDRLIIGLNTDASVRKLKGAKRPIQSEADRAMILDALKSVDGVVLFDEKTPLELITALKPDFLVKGGDYSIETIVGAKEVIRRKGEVKVIPFLEGYSTSKIIKKILQSE
ncbi:MAG: D-glycero-beta-D-manno-heptose 1-phosphate adenylyltransferase [Candidatus Marinimicrobia bacterium]|nr:D-glycero-beta-D-manno-heptose 1-phosphate adenylyltransferase [Candidatus Neomarinimicrobiota bacterium]